MGVLLDTTINKLGALGGCSSAFLTRHGELSRVKK
jgi:hypothetical protein